MNKKYEIICADPPFEYTWKQTPYPTMSLEELKKLEVNRLPIKQMSTTHSCCFMWASGPQLKNAIEVMEAWGFKHSTIAFTWVKLNGQDKPRNGLGSWTRSCCEFVLFGKRGRPKRVNNCVSQFLMERNRQHSREPYMIRKMIVELMGDKKPIELFARRFDDSLYFEGCDVFGNEV